MSAMRWPLGDTGATGEMPPFDAVATAASASAPANGVTRRSESPAHGRVAFYEGG